MIYDALDNLSLYKSMYSYLDVVIDFLDKNELGNLKTGRYEILNDKVYVNIVESVLQDEMDMFYEMHRQYLDLHIDIVGSELIKFADYNEMNIVKEYDRENDYCMLKGDSISSCVLNKRHFLLCMIGEPHMPCLRYGTNTKIKKAIFKILVND